MAPILKGELGQATAGGTERGPELGFWLGNIGLLHSALAGTDGRWRFAFEANDLAIDLGSLAAGAGEGVMDAATSIDAVVGRLDFGLGVAAARTPPQR